MTFGVSHHAQCLKILQNVSFLIFKNWILAAKIDVRYNFWRENWNKTFFGDFHTLCLYCKGVCKKSILEQKFKNTEGKKKCFVNPFGIFEVIENGKLSKKNHLSKKIFNFSQNWMSWLEVEQTFFSPQISPRGKTCCHCQKLFLDGFP